MAQPEKTAQQIITAFELQVNDITELSSDEELGILNRKYQELLSIRPWEFLKKNAQGVIAQDVNGYYITLPVDFNYLFPNYSYTDNAIATEINSAPIVIFMVNGITYTPCYVINYSDRRQYVNRGNYAYVDLANGVLRFLGTPVYTSYDFDYIKVAPVLTVSDKPIFPGQFHDILVFGMATDNEILQLSPKATSYAQENNAKYLEYVANMEYRDAQFTLN